MTEKRKCPRCDSTNWIYHRESSYSGMLLKESLSCENCGYESEDLNEWVEETFVVPDRYCWITEGLLEDIRDVLLQANRNDLIEKIDEVLK